MSNIEERPAEEPAVERAVENDGAEEIAAQESLPREKPDHLPRLLALIAGTVVASVAFRLAIGMGIQHTSFVFIGIPALLATAVALSGPAETATGTTMRSVTLALLIALTFFGEATICVLMASPIIFLVAGLVVAADKIAARNRRRERRAGFATVPALVLAAAAVPAMEGVVPGFELPREASVTATRVVAATPAEVERALAAPMRFDRRLPAFLRLGFPTPAATHGEGLRVGDRRSVMLEHGHHHSGELVMEVASASPGRARFVPVDDESYITHWLTWRSAEVRWRAAPGGTEVRWTLRYRRRLDPAWYFGPLERYGARAAAGYLVDALATPAGAQP